ncbi:ANTAR domain-containing protein [Streptomyces liliiviolaceus]
MQEIAQLRTALERRPVIDMARGVLMALWSCSADDAWEVLVNVSQHSNTKLYDIAEASSPPFAASRCPYLCNHIWPPQATGCTHTDGHGPGRPPCSHAAQKPSVSDRRPVTPTLDDHSRTGLLTPSLGRFPMARRTGSSPRPEPACGPGDQLLLPRRVTGADLRFLKRLPHPTDYRRVCSLSPAT